MSKPKAQFIDPRDVGLRTLDLKTPLFDASALARADRVMETLGESMQHWLDADVERLQAARLAAEQAGWSDAAIDAVLAPAHDIKGMGASLGNPLASQIGASLCRLIETPAGKNTARRDPSLLVAHVDALRASVRDRVTEASHPIGRALLAALETRVQRLGVAPD